jgi:hypothetical protein
MILHLYSKHLHSSTSSFVVLPDSVGDYICIDNTNNMCIECISIDGREYIYKMSGVYSDLELFV